ncbi:uncharacterized protein RHO25_003391 [Cercospora beticola]|uniref:BTB domain-containing protein n=1 Tax=Cercospora beticola TaxID=122368 RepID=A0ABZ0NGW5_CERBT|nr:hypothetical protein RHO25_003391 [Cercospora beticola]CAK1360058.1 unnamed protein product [Cercospora beticola]
MSDIVALNIGEDNDMDNTIRVHKSCLEDRGGFFTAALKRGWKAIKPTTSPTMAFHHGADILKEGQENNFPLPEDETDIVATYVEWLSVSFSDRHASRLSRKSWLGIRRSGVTTPVGKGVRG